jgi:ABC-type glycerol-3-phosphate transport system permease component
MIQNGSQAKTATSGSRVTDGTNWTLRVAVIVIALVTILLVVFRKRKSDAD